jgi:hypothetical protein
MSCPFDNSANSADEIANPLRRTAASDLAGRREKIADASKAGWKTSRTCSTIVVISSAVHASFPSLPQWTAAAAAAAAALGPVAAAPPGPVEESFLWDTAATTLALVTVCVAAV